MYTGTKTGAGWKNPRDWIQTGKKRGHGDSVLQ